jgi:hypothetical protein
MTEEETLDALRRELDLGIQSLDRGEGRELTLEQILQLARARHATRLNKKSDAGDEAEAGA